MEQKTLKELKMEHRYTLNQIAEGTGVPFGTIVGYYYNNRKITMENARKIADFFGIRMEEIKQEGKQ